MNLTLKTLAVAVLVAGAPALAGPASAQSAGGPQAQSTPWRASPYWAGDYDYGPGPGYAYDLGYSDYGSDYAYAPAPYAGAPAGGSTAAYCAQRYRSYDPASGTYLGYDGIRHSCP